MSQKRYWIRKTFSDSTSRGALAPEINRWNENGTTRVTLADHRIPGGALRETPSFIGSDHWVPLADLGVRDILDTNPGQSNPDYFRIPSYTVGASSDLLAIKLNRYRRLRSDNQGGVKVSNTDGKFYILIGRDQGYSMETIADTQTYRWCWVLGNCYGGNTHVTP